MAVSDTSTAVTRSAPPNAAFRAKEPVCVKQSSTFLPAAILATGLTVVFLIKEKAGLLPVLHIYLVLYAVFGYPGDRGGRLGQIISQVPALASIQTLELTDSYVVALEYAGNVYAFLCELLYELAVYGILYPFHTYGEHLRDEDVFVAVYGKAGQPLRLRRIPGGSSDSQ